jgi:hypothetical protein
VRDCWFIGLKWSTTIVAAGLVLELPELWYELADIARSRFDRFRYRVVLLESRIQLAKAIAFIGWLLIVGGVVGERVAEVKVNDLDASIQGCNAAKLSEAVVGVGDANERASKNEEEAAALRLENTRLEAVIQPRSLSLENQGKIANECRSFRGHAVMVRSYAMDGEAYELGGQVIAVLNSANINSADDRATSLFTGAFESGIHVRGEGTELDTAACLAKALRTIGKLKVELNDQPPPFGGGGMAGGGKLFNPGVPFATVVIGVKPLLTLTPVPSTASK